MRLIKYWLFAFVINFSILCSAQSVQIDFSKNWQFHFAEDSLGNYPVATNWRNLNVPHDWSIEGSFSEKHPTTNNEAALPAGIAWYQKSFVVPDNFRNKKISIHFEGVFCNSEVWINDHYVGKRPNGYVPFEYELTEFLKKGNAPNFIKVKVDNSKQPNSRYYTGSGIYRSVSLVAKDNIYFPSYAVFVTTPFVNQQEAKIRIQSTVNARTASNGRFQLLYQIVDANNTIVVSAKSELVTYSQTDSVHLLEQTIKLSNPKLWNTEHPYLYTTVVKIIANGVVKDLYSSKMGIRSIRLDAAKGFYLNEEQLKIKGVCNHADLGSLGTAVNKWAIKRQLLLLKEMGCNAIRTAHNPPATEFLDLCDELGFLVMDEAFDSWQKKKNKYDYSKDFKQWHKADLEAMVLRDRNHPSVFMWSVGNEIREQFDSTGTEIASDLYRIVKALDQTRPVTNALTENIPSKNFITKANALDVLGFNYKQYAYDSLPGRFPGLPIIAAETGSALETRGNFMLPADGFHLWPPDSKNGKTGNDELSCNAYDNTFAYWGATHEQSWLAVKNRSFIAGLFAWSGFDFLGEPVPYPYPARSSYYGIIDLAGLPKDVYYMYQSEWSNKTVLHLLPHWNWKKEDLVDVWAYYNNADEVELFLNGKSLGKKSKIPNMAHVSWKVPFVPGILKAVSTKNKKIVHETEYRTAGDPYKIILTAEKNNLTSVENELGFIKASIVDKNGVLVPNANNEIEFLVEGQGRIQATDNGLQTDLTSFQSTKRKTFNGLCIAIINSDSKKGIIKVRAKSANLVSAELNILVK